MKTTTKQIFITRTGFIYRVSYLLISFMLVLGLGLMACEGPEGPQGPQGEQGPEGLQGPEGTANVIYSDWFESEPWTPVEFFGDSVRHFDMIAPDLTQDIVDKGVVNVYADFVNTDFIFQLPVSDFPGFEGSTLFHKIKPDTVRVTLFNEENPNTDPGSFPSDNRFRYVIIPGGQSAQGSASKVNSKELEEMSYEELQQRFNIPDSGSGTISFK